MTFSIVVVISRGVEGQSRRGVFLKCFDSLLSQDYAKDAFEIVVVDSGSGFGEADFKALKEEAFRVGVRLSLIRPFSDPGSGCCHDKGKWSANSNPIASGHNLGPARARNLGILAVTEGQTGFQSEAIAFTDDDVLVPVDWLSWLVRGFRKFPDAAGVGGTTLPPRDLVSSNVWAAYDQVVYRRYFNHRLADNFFISYRCDEHPVFTGNLAYRRKILEEVHGFDESFRPFEYGEDADLKERVLRRGYFLVYAPVTNRHLAVYNFRRFARQQEARGAGIMKYRKKHQRHCPSYPEVYLRLAATPVAFLVYFYRLGFSRLDMAILETLAYFYRQLGKLTFLRLTPNSLAAPERKRVLFLDHTPLLGGAQLALLRHLKHLDRRRFAPSVVVSPNLPSFKEKLNRLSDLDVFYLTFPKFKPVSPASLIQLIIPVMRLLLLMKSQKIDLVVANTERTYYPAFLAATVLRKKIILIIRDFEYSKWLLRLTRVWVFRFICVSRRIKEFYGLKEPQAAVVYVGSDLFERLKRVSPAAVLEIRRNLKLSREAVVVGFVGRLITWKGPFLLLAAFAEIVNSKKPEPNSELGWEKPLKLVLVGEGPEKAALVSAINEFNLARHVAVIDFAEDIEVWYQTFDIFVQASTGEEPFATTVIEAALSRLPIIATKTGGTGEFIKNGVNGLLVEPRVESLKRALVTLIENPKLGEKMAEQAFQQATASYSEEVITGALAQIYSRA